MGDRLLFETIDRQFKDILKNNKPMGGVTMVFSGDWRQCLPIIPHGSRGDIIHRTLKRCLFWHHMKVFSLTENMRIANAGDNDVAFADYLLRVGEGREPIDETVGEKFEGVPIPL